MTLAALEAMACGRPSIVANEGFRGTLELWAKDLLFRHGDVKDLAAKMAALLMMPERSRQEMGIVLCQSVTARHSLERFADQLVELFEESRR